MQENYWQLGRWKGIPVSMHWTVLIMCAWFYMWTRDLLTTVISSCTYFSLLVAHEFGHVVMLRKRKIAISGVAFYGLHGQTNHEYIWGTDKVLVAWSGVAVQFVILLLALGANEIIDFSYHPYLYIFVEPILSVLTSVNMFLIIVALLPIGPFDGRAAWAVIPMLRENIRQYKRKTKLSKSQPPKLSPKKQKELEEKSSQATAELMEKFTKKNKEPKDSD